MAAYGEYNDMAEQEWKETLEAWVKKDAKPWR